MKSTPSLLCFLVVAVIYSFPIPSSSAEQDNWERVETPSSIREGGEAYTRKSSSGGTCGVMAVNKTSPDGYVYISVYAYRNIGEQKLEHRFVGLIASGTTKTESGRSIKINALSHRSVEVDMGDGKWVSTEDTTPRMFVDECQEYLPSLKEDIKHLFRGLFGIGGKSYQQT